jgi:transcriptional regulator with XRE-family HTH domain
LEAALPKIVRDGFDHHLGARIRELRERAKISQLELGRRLGVTFQQVQKYENGSNRVSASKLFRLAELLGVEVSHFYENFEKGEVPEPLVISEADERRRALLKFADSAEGLALLNAYLTISDKKVRARMLTLMRSVSAGQPAAELAVVPGDG